MKIHEIQCRWWLHTPCAYQATTLTLMCCQQGHIRERLLCNHHTATTTAYITENSLLCTQCASELTRYLTRTPIENHWDIHGALNDTQGIRMKGLWAKGQHPETRTAENNYGQWEILTKPATANPFPRTYTRTVKKLYQKLTKPKHHYTLRV